MSSCSYNFLVFIPIRVFISCSQRTYHLLQGIYLWTVHLRDEEPLSSWELHRTHSSASINGSPLALFSIQGIAGWGGGLSEFITVRQDSVFVVPSDIPRAEFSLAMVSPVSWIDIFVLSRYSCNGRTSLGRLPCSQEVQFCSREHRSDYWCWPCTFAYISPFSSVHVHSTSIS